MMNEKPSNIVERFWKYEQENNYERLSLYILSATIRKLATILKVRKSSPLTALSIASSIYLSRTLLSQNLKEIDKKFLEKYILEEINIFQRKLLSDIINLKLRKEYELLFDRFVQNLYSIWILYNNGISRSLDIFFYVIEVNNLDVLYDTVKLSLRDKLVINIYIILFYRRIYNNVFNKKKPKILKDKELPDLLTKVGMEVKNIFKNTLFINELENFDKHFDIVAETLTTFIKSEYEKDNTYSRINQAVTDFDFFRYLLVIGYNLLNPYDPIVIRYLTEYIKNDAETFLDFATTMKSLLVQNQEYEEILLEIPMYKNIGSSVLLNDDPTLFQAKNVHFSYNDKSETIVNLNLSINRFQWNHFKGASGQGKTTLFNLLLQRHKHQRGQMFFQGNESYSYENIKHLISIVSTSYDLFDNYSILLNITYGLKKVDEDTIKKIEYYLEKFQMKHLKYRLHDKMEGLSTGENKRIKLIRLILHDRPIWFLDEVTANLNDELEKVVLDELFKIKTEKKKTVLFISHNKSTLRYADVIYNIDNKQVNQLE